MPAPSGSLLVLVLALGMGSTAAAQPEAIHEGLGIRRIELHATPSDAEPEVGIRSGVSTVLTFDAASAGAQAGRFRVELERSSTFQRVESGASVLRLVPSGELKAGDRVRLTVHFEDGAAPARVTFVLVVRADLPDRLVEVYRERRPVESYQQEVREVLASLRQCQEALANANAAPGGLTGLMALRTSKVLGDKGVVTRSFGGVAARLRSDAFLAERLHTHRAASRVLVEVSLGAREQGESWTAQGATLTGPGGESLKVLSVWQASPVMAGMVSQVLVEAEAGEAIPLEGWTLRLWEEGPGRTVVLEDLSFASLSRQVEDR